MMSVILGGARVLGCAFSSATLALEASGCGALGRSVSKQGRGIRQGPLDFNGGEAALAAYDLHCGAEAMPRHRLIPGWS